MNFVWVALGGAMGASLRYGASLLSPQPWTIAAINIIGSFMMGFLALRLAGQNEMRLFFTTGILGGFTTFSAFSLDTVSFMSKGEGGQALAYVLFSVIISIAACYLGMSLGRATL